MESKQDFNPTMSRTSNQPYKINMQMNPNEPFRPDMHMNPNETFRPTMNMNPYQTFRPTMNMNPNETFRPTMHLNPNEPFRPDMHMNPNEPFRPTMHMNPNEPFKPNMQINPNETFRPNMHMNSNETFRPNMHMNPNETFRPNMHMNTNEQFRPTMNSNPNESFTPTINMKTNQPYRPNMHINPNELYRPAMHMTSNKSFRPILQMNSNQPLGPSIPMESNQPFTPSIPMESNQPFRPSPPVVSSQYSKPSIPMQSNTSFRPTLKMKCNNDWRNLESAEINRKSMNSNWQPLFQPQIPPNIEKEEVNENNPSCLSYSAAESEESHLNISSNDLPLWLTKWKNKVGETTMKMKPKIPEIKLHEVQQQLQKWKFHFEKLKIVHQLLNEADDTSEIRNLQNEISIHQSSINRLKDIFENKSYQKKVKRLVHNRKKKRQRVKAKRKVNKVLHQKKLEARAIKSREIDERHDKILKEEFEKREAVILKKETDTVLLEVRKKITETENMKKILEVLNKLRNDRLTKRKNETNHLDNENDIFKPTIDKLELLLNIKMKQYDLEKKTLKVMLEDTKCSKKPTKPLLNNKQNNVKRILFGSVSSYVEDNASDLTLEQLVQRRNDWDAYISNELSSSIPTKWVLPPEDPSTNWQLYQINLKK